MIAPVQTDKTKEALVEITKELKGVLGDKPISDDELKKAQSKQTLQLPGSMETTGAVAGAIARIARSISLIIISSLIPAKSARSRNPNSPMPRRP